jgi:hypothetical protein
LRHWRGCRGAGRTGAQADRNEGERHPVELSNSGRAGAEQAPIRDAVSGQDKEVQIVYPKGGFFWNTGNIATTEVLEANYGPVKFRHGGGFASYAVTTWTNQQ